MPRYSPALEGLAGGTDTVVGVRSLSPRRTNAWGTATAPSSNTTPPTTTHRSHRKLLGFPISGSY